MTKDSIYANKVVKYIDMVRGNTYEDSIYLERAIRFSELMCINHYEVKKFRKVILDKLYNFQSDYFTNERILRFINILIYFWRDLVKC